MAKKKPTKKAAKPAKKKATARKSAPKRAAAPKHHSPLAFNGANHRQPVKRTTARAETLPGMEEVRDRELDDLCGDLADCLTAINDATATKREKLASTLRRMHALGLTFHKANGVKVVRASANETISVKLVKDNVAGVVAPVLASTEEDDEDDDQGGVGLDDDERSDLAGMAR